VEFSGIKSDGQRVMGLVKSGALSSTIDQNNALLWKVPQNWTLKQAATVPYSFFVVIILKQPNNI
jgi:fatty acid synthase